MSAFDHYRPDGIDLGEDPYWLLGLNPEPLMDGKITWRADQERITLHGVPSTLTVAETDSLVTALMRWKTWMQANRSGRVFLPDLPPEEQRRIIELFSSPTPPDQLRVTTAQDFARVELSVSPDEEGE